MWMEQPWQLRPICQFCDPSKYAYVVVITTSHLVQCLWWFAKRRKLKSSCKTMHNTTTCHTRRSCKAALSTAAATESMRSNNEQAVFEVDVRVKFIQWHEDCNSCAQLLIHAGKGVEESLLTLSALEGLPGLFVLKPHYWRHRAPAEGLHRSRQAKSSASTCTMPVLSVLQGPSPGFCLQVCKSLVLCVQ